MLAFFNLYAQLSRIKVCDRIAKIKQKNILYWKLTYGMLEIISFEKYE